MAGYYQSGVDVGDAGLALINPGHSDITQYFLNMNLLTSSDTSPLGTYDSSLQVVSSEWLVAGSGLTLYPLSGLRAFAKLTTVYMQTPASGANLIYSYTNSRAYPVVLIVLVEGDGGPGGERDSRGSGGGGSGYVSYDRIVLQPGDSVSFTSVYYPDPVFGTAVAVIIRLDPGNTHYAYSMLANVLKAPGWSWSIIAAAGSGGSNSYGGTGFRNGGDDEGKDGGFVAAGAYPIDGWSYPPASTYRDNGLSSLSNGGGGGGSLAKPGGLGASDTEYNKRYATAGTWGSGGGGGSVARVASNGQRALGGRGYIWILVPTAI